MLLVGVAFTATASILGLYPELQPPPPRSASAAICDVTSAPWNAKGDGVSKDTAAIQKCIDECGGKSHPDLVTVLIPEGTFLTGGINLTSNLIFQVEGTLLGSTAPSDYPVVRALPGYGISRDGGYVDPTEHAGFRHQALISGWNLTNVSIVGSGKGVIDGQGLIEDARLKSSWVTRFKNKSDDYGRPRLIEPMFADDFRVENIKLTNPAFWCLHPYGCNDVYIADVQIIAPRDEGIPNDDGIDPDSCGNVLVERCFVSVGDNSVAIKSGMDRAGREFNRPTFNVVMRHSQFTCETWAIGSEMSGGVFNITVHDCEFGGNHSDFVGVHLKTKRGRGSAIHDIVVRDSVFHSEFSVKQPQPISAAMLYGQPAPPTNQTATPHVHDVRFDNCTIYLPAKEGAAAARPTFEFIGLPESKMEKFTFKDIKVIPASGSHGWACSNTSGFSFLGEFDPPPPLSCLVAN